MQRVWCDTKDRMMRADEAFALDCDTAHNTASVEVVRFLKTVRDAITNRICEIECTYSESIELCDEYNDAAIELADSALAVFNGELLERVLSSFSLSVAEAIITELREGI